MLGLRSIAGKTAGAITIRSDASVMRPCARCTVCTPYPGPSVPAYHVYA